MQFYRKYSVETIIMPYRSALPRKINIKQGIIRSLNHPAIKGNRSPITGNQLSNSAGAP